MKNAREDFMHHPNKQNITTVDTQIFPSKSSGSHKKAMTSEDCEDSGDRHGGPGLEARGRVTNRDAVKILLTVLQKRREISSEKRKYVLFPA